MQLSREWSARKDQMNCQPANITERIRPPKNSTTLTTASVDHVVPPTPR